MKSPKKEARIPNGLEIIGMLLVFTAIMLLSIMVFEIPVAMALILVWTFMILFGLYLGNNYDSLQEGIQEGISKGLQGVLILITVGALIGTWIIGGIVPTLIYYGTNFIHPSIFLFAAMILCMVTSIATGTSWGTLGTAGIAMMGVAQSFGIPLPLAAGALISGAFMGDKISPLSDTTVLTSSLSNVDIIKHIKSMFYVTIPAFVITSILFIIVGFFYVDGSVSMVQAEETQAALQEFFNIQWYMLIPALIVIVLLMMKKPSVPTIAFGALLGSIWAVLFQEKSINESFMAIYEGYSAESNYLIINELLNRGGIMFMLDVILIILLALGLGGLMDKIGILQVLTNIMSSWINKRKGRLTTATMSTALFGTAFGGSTYVGIITGSKITEKNYEEMKIDKTVLSRNTEAGATVTSPLFPWVDGGVFVSAVLGVSTLSYLPFAWYNLLVIFISIVYGYTGLFMWNTNEVNQTDNEMQNVTEETEKVNIN
ncbi:Na+/H+ antiporter NhaC [Oceanobacillus locisalsi]|uniref:Na+/H+ antiporter NhaC n=1 Tax=Oceanobacillus locisalsi TaxID=546107 RepID=A0ABW3NEF6_9BACI